MIFGYARTSTVEQANGLQAQIDELHKQGCERVYSEQVSGRQELTRLLDNLRLRTHSQKMMVAARQMVEKKTF
ncbi:hypothetical protein HK22_09940, partial [Gluconobacter sp. DsW_056]|uniref:recombinase family protein n=1 Tax=Gluconobacter sp. DsW_056 TaxID=1511209 RepID=UPI000B7553E3